MLTMFDVAFKDAGASVILSTCCDEENPPENIIDGSSQTFWMSTGLYPQEFVISFAGLMNVNSVAIECNSVRNLRVERSIQNEPQDFEVIGEKELENLEGHIQSEEFPISNNTTAQHLRFSIDSAYDHFISVHKVVVNGTAIHG